MGMPDHYQVDPDHLLKVKHAIWDRLVNIEDANRSRCMLRRTVTVTVKINPKSN